MKSNLIYFFLLTLIISIVSYCLMVNDIFLVEVRNDLIFIKSKSLDYGVINTDGTIYYNLGINYDYAGNYLVINKEQHYQLVDLNNPKNVIKTYNHLTFKKRFDDYTVFLNEDTKKDLLIGRNGDIIEMETSFADYISSKLDRLNKLFYNSYAIVSNENKMGFINKEGKVTIEPYYTYVSGYSKANKSVACESMSDLLILDCGLIDTEGNELTQFIYDPSELDHEVTDSIPTYDDFKVEQKDGLYGVTHVEEVIIPFQYDEIENIKGRYFKVKINNQYGVFDHHGHVILEPVYDWLYIELSVWNPDIEIIKAKKDNRWGVFDLSGNCIIDFEYDLIRRFSYYDKNTYDLKYQYYYVVTKDNKEGFLYRNGDSLTDIIYEFATVGGNTLLVVKDGITYSIDPKDRTERNKSTSSYAITNEKEVIYGKNGNIYKIDVNNKTTLLYNKYLKMHQGNILNIIESIPIGIVTSSLVLYLIKRIKNNRKDLEEKRKYLDL